MNVTYVSDEDYQAWAANIKHAARDRIRAGL